MNSHTTEQLLMCEKGDLVKYIQELKSENSYLTDWNIEKLNENYVPLEDYKELRAELSELKKRGEESLQLTMSQNEKFMDELEEKNKVIDTLKKSNEQKRLEWIKLKNANELYKGYACGILEQQIQDDLCEICMGEIDIRLTNWLSKFLQEKFYEEIVPELINEITDDGMYSFGGYDDTYEIEDLGSGRISITHIERSSSDDEVDSSDDDE